MNTRSSTKKRGIDIAFDDAAQDSIPQNKKFNRKQLNWKTRHPYLKVSKPAEDICQYCYTFANKHKILTEQEQQQQQQSDDDGGDGDDDDDHDSTSNDESNVVDDDNDVDDDDVDDVDGDDLAVLEKMIKTVNLKETGAASTTAREAKEKLIIRCKSHIDMARAQRVVYQTLENNARDNATA